MHAYQTHWFWYMVCFFVSLSFGLSVRRCSCLLFLQHLRFGWTANANVKEHEVRVKIRQSCTKREYRNNNNKTSNVNSMHVWMCVNVLVLVCWWWFKWFKVNWLFSNVCTTLFEGTKRRKWIYLFLKKLANTTHSFVRMVSKKKGIFSSKITALLCCTVQNRKLFMILWMLQTHFSLSWLLLLRSFVCIINAKQEVI